MSTGFLANFALFSTLPRRHDAIVFDDLIHASVKEGIHASLARRYRAKHNDPDAFRDAALRARRRGAQELWIAIESVYSMDGDVAPVGDLLALAEELNAMLVVDEAHATGVFGPGGRGVCEGLRSERLIQVHTCGKGLGVAGALVCGPGPVIDVLINSSRAFIYSTAPPPAVAKALVRALDIVEGEPERRERLWQRVRLAGVALGEVAGGGQGIAPSQILPVVLGSEERTLRVAKAVQGAGYDVRAIRPPTVPAGTSRLRIVINANHGESDISGLAAALGDALANGTR